MSLPKPYYEESGITIYCGDCRDILPHLEPVDLVLTDPPYGVNYKSGRSNNHELIVGDDSTNAFYSCLPLILKCLRRGRHIYTFGRFSYEGFDIGGKCEIIWDKQTHGMGDISLPWASSHEVIQFGVYQPSKVNRSNGAGRLSARIRKGSIIKSQRGISAQTLRHPTEKPVEVLQELIESSSCFSETILDPFMGSGTTLVAAKLEYRKAIGIEIEEKYCEIAVKRLRQQVLDFNGKSFRNKE